MRDKGRHAASLNGRPTLKIMLTCLCVANWA